MKAILPQEEEGVTGFSTIGHIVHLNLREHHEPYKSVIGQALLQLPTARTVINKNSSIVCFPNIMLKPIVVSVLLASKHNA